MTGHKAYQHYLALKKHFNEDKYSVFDKPRVEIPEAIFIKRNERWLWEKFAEGKSGPELMTFMVANMAKGHDSFIFDMEKAEELSTQWLRAEQSVTRLFELELESIHSLCPDSKKLLEFNGPTPPGLLQLYLGGRVSLHTMVLLNSHLNYLDDWKGSMSFLFENEIRRIDKSQRFIKFNKDRIKKVIEQFDI